MRAREEGGEEREGLGGHACLDRDVLAILQHGGSNLRPLSVQHCCGIALFLRHHLRWPRTLDTKEHEPEKQDHRVMLLDHNTATWIKTTTARFNHRLRVHRSNPGRLSDLAISIFFEFIVQMGVVAANVPKISHSSYAHHTRCVIIPLWEVV